MREFTCKYGLKGLSILPASLAAEDYEPDEQI
jgi:hypothetical protein